VDDLGHVQVERKSVPRTHRDRRELRVVIVRLGPAGPIEHNVRGGHQLHLHHPRIERVFARVRRRYPNAFVTRVDEVAVLELNAADVLVRGADE
jgi:hypothetical protein